MQANLCCLCRTVARIQFGGCVLEFLRNRALRCDIEYRIHILSQTSAALMLSKRGKDKRLLPWLSSQWRSPNRLVPVSTDEMGASRSIG